jgi:hypothetical protein
MNTNAIKNSRECSLADKGDIAQACCKARNCTEKNPTTCYGPGANLPTVHSLGGYLYLDPEQERLAMGLINLDAL